MRRNKPGLADLKTLRRQADNPEPAPSPARPQRAARKRAPFLPPAPEKTQVPEAAKAQPGPARSSQAASPAGPSHGSGTGASTLLSEADRKLFLQAVRYVEKIKDPGRVLLPPVPPAPPSMLKEKRMRAAGMESSPARKPTPSADKPRETQPAPRASRTLSDNYASATTEQDDSRHLKPGHGTDILRDLKRGKWPIGASLDLHGSDLEDARERFERFLTSCLTHDIKCVRIVHGKGYGSKNGDAVLKTTVRRWLTQLTEVIAYTECPETDGGAGAVQVLLK